MLVLLHTLNALVSVVVNTDDIVEMTMMRDRHHEPFHATIRMRGNPEPLVVQVGKPAGESFPGYPNLEHFYRLLGIKRVEDVMET